MSRASRIMKSAEFLDQAAGFQKSAAMWSPGYGSIGAMGDAPVSRLPMGAFSPLYQQSNLMLPKDRKTMNAYNRHYYETDYWVGNAIDLHVTYPLGGFEIVSKEREVEKVMNRMAEHMNLFELVLGVGLDYWVYGEAFPYLHWDSVQGMWDSGVIYNPDYVDVTRNIFTPRPLISLIPDTELKRLATSTHPKDLLIRDQIPSEIMEYVIRGQNIPLSNRNISHIARKTVPHDVRGTSIIQRVWKELMLRDAFREVLFVTAQNHVTPLKIYKVGSREKEYFPTQEELAYWQTIIEQAQNDPNFSLITHDAFDVQYVGASGSIIDVTGYLKLIEEYVLTGLFLSKAFTTSDGPTYSNSVVAYEVLQKRYAYFRSIIQKWLINKVFLPVSIAQGFKNKDGHYIVPQVRWASIDFKKDDGWRSLLVQLNSAGNKLVSDRTLVTELGLDFDNEQDQIVKEQAAKAARKQLMKDLSAEMSEGGLLGGSLLGGSLLGGAGAQFSSGELAASPSSFSAPPPEASGTLPPIS